MVSRKAILRAQAILRISPPLDPGPESSPQSLSRIFLRSPFRHQVDWKTSNEGLLEDWADRLAPEYYVDWQRQDQAARIWREGPDGQVLQQLVLPDLDSLDPSALLTCVFSLLPTRKQVLRLRQFDGGDSVELLVLDADTAEQLRVTLGELWDTLFS